MDLNKTLKLLKKFHSHSKKARGDERLQGVFKFEDSTVFYTNGHFLIKFSCFTQLKDGIYPIEDFIGNEIQSGVHYPDFNLVVNREWTHCLTLDSNPRLDDLLYTLCLEGVYVAYHYLGLLQDILNTFDIEKVFINKSHQGEPVLFEFKYGGVFMIMPYNFEKLSFKEV